MPKQQCQSTEGKSVEFRTTYKVATSMHNSFFPSMLCSVSQRPHHILHQRFSVTSTTRSAVVCRTRTQFGRRAFSVCGPNVWNSLPSKLRVIDSHATFWRALKGHIFNTAISCSLSHWLAFLKDSRSVLMYDWALELFSSITLYDRIDRITTGSQTRRFRLWAKCHNSSTQFCV